MAPQSFVMTSTLDFLKDRIVLLMQERDKAIGKADELQATVKIATELVNQVVVLSGTL